MSVQGRKRADWPAEGVRPWLSTDAAGEFVALPGAVFRFAAAPLVVQDGQNTVLGELQLATALDADYAAELSALSGAGTVIVSHGGVVASTLPAAATRGLSAATLAVLGSSDDSLVLDGEHYAVKLLFRHGSAAVYTLDSIDASAAPLLAAALRAPLLIALGSLALAGCRSLWLAHTVARPIDTLSRSLTALTQSRDFGTPVRATGSSLEVDALTDTFNTHDGVGVRRARRTRAARTSARFARWRSRSTRGIRTRPAIRSASAPSRSRSAHQMGLPEDELDTLRLGALLHDIGKIGISDDVLRKPGPLTDEEFEAIKEHPVTGARILRTVPFLAPHLPIVELHHERPDGKGYPHGLHGDEIPLLARIVHVADAFDAITSARAYRPARGGGEALQELWRCAGSQFDAEVVQALAGSIPTLRLHDRPLRHRRARAPRGGRRWSRSPAHDARRARRGARSPALPRAERRRAGTSTGRVSADTVVSVSMFSAGRSRR